MRGEMARHQAEPGTCLRSHALSRARSAARTLAAARSAMEKSKVAQAIASVFVSLSARGGGGGRVPRDRGSGFHFGVQGAEGVLRAHRSSTLPVRRGPLPHRNSAAPQQARPSAGEPRPWARCEQRRAAKGQQGLAQPGSAHPDAGLHAAAVHELEDKCDFKGSLTQPEANRPVKHASPRPRTLPPPPKNSFRYLVTGLLSEVLTNNAAAALMYPIASSVGDDMSVSAASPPAPTCAHPRVRGRPGRGAHHTTPPFKQAHTHPMPIPNSNAPTLCADRPQADVHCGDAGRQRGVHPPLRIPGAGTPGPCWEFERTSARSRGRLGAAAALRVGCREDPPPVSSQPLTLPLCLLCTSLPQCNLMVFSAGNYRTIDFVKVGVLLQVRAASTLAWKAALHAWKLARRRLRVHPDLRARPSSSQPHSPTPHDPGSALPHTRTIGRCGSWWARARSSLPLARH